MWATISHPEDAHDECSTLARPGQRRSLGLEQALYAFLVEKGNRSGSKRTVESYRPDALALLRRAQPDAREGQAC